MTSTELATDMSLTSLDVSRSEAPNPTRKYRNSHSPRDLAFTAGTLLMAGSLHSDRMPEFGKWSQDIQGKSLPTTHYPVSGSFSYPTSDNNNLGKLVIQVLEKKNRDKIAKSFVAKNIRAPYAGQIISSLTKLTTCAREPKGAVHVDRILNVIQTLSDLLPYDPFTRLVMAFYDSLATGNRWASYTSEQFEKAKDILRNAHQKGFLSDAGLRSALNAFESVGFSTIPFSINFDEIDEGE